MMVDNTSTCFISVFTKDGMPAESVQQLIMYNWRFQELSVKSINGKLSGYESLLLRDARNKIENLCDLYKGFAADFSGDPRGPIVTITVPSGESNCVGGGMTIPSLFTDVVCN